MRYKATDNEPYLKCFGIPLLVDRRRFHRKKASTLRQLIDAAQYCISRYANSSCPLGSADKSLDRWISRESMTLGRVVAPRSMPDEAPGLEHTIHNCYYGFLIMGLRSSMQNSICIVETR